MVDPNGNGAGAAAQESASNTPILTVLAQYTKDFSFENPNAPRSLAAQDRAPDIQIQVNVNAKQLAEPDFEVDLILEGAATNGEATVFKFELHYAGVFRVKNIQQQDMSPLVMIECPRLLFPFARQIIADAVRGGGFPPLFIDPIDFHGLYRQRIMELQGQSATA
jgi:preprotein translocase subunit SecB